MKKIFLFMIIASTTFSQSHDNDHRKYWYYKSRLNNDFVKVGTGSGESLPFNERGIYSDGSPVHYSTHLALGDGTSTLGLYLGVLATEYRLLKNNGQTESIKRVNHELYCALNAINRLDFNAETIYSGTPPSLNGFFIRDDIPKDFVADNYAHFNYYNSSSDPSGAAINTGGLVKLQGVQSSNNIYSTNPSNYSTDHGFLSVIPNGMYITESDYQQRQQDQNNTDLLESQDQVYALLMGLALTAKIVDAGETDNNINFGGSGQPKLAQEARNITKRIVDYIRNSNSCSGLPWKVKDPISCADVPRGPDAYPYAYPLSQAACFVVNNTDMLPDYSATIPINCYDFNDNANYNTSVVGHDAWAFFEAISGGLDNDQQAFYNYLAPVCNCVFYETTLEDPEVEQALETLQSLVDDICGWFHCPHWLENEINNYLGQLFYNKTFNVTALSLVSNESFWPIVAPGSGGASGPFDTDYNGSKMYHGAYLHGVLHGIISNVWTSESALSLNVTMKGLIDAAPCEGNYNFGNFLWGDREWSSDNRVEHTNRIGSTNIAGNKLIPGEYNGLDYMFYHNLYYLFNYNNDSRIVNLSDRIIDFTIPVSSEFNTIGNSVLPSGGNNTNDGSHGNPATVGAFETIEADNDITNAADVTYRAGKTIHLVANGASQQFHVAAGANFHAYTYTFSCGGGDYNRTATTSQDTGKKPELYLTASMYDGALHGTSPQEWHIPVQQTVTTKNNVAKTDSINNMIKDVLKKANITPAMVEVFPNPNNGKFTLKNTFSIYNYTITDVVGNLIVIGQMTSKSTEIDLSYVQKGVYFISIDDGSGNKQMKKIIIN